jgi:flagellar assembly protein FliH
MAGIIKSGIWQQAANTANPAAFNFQDIASQADDYLTSIRRQATQILTQAKAQVAAIEAEARLRGQQAAIEQAGKSSQEYLDQKLKSLLPALENAITAIQQSQATWLQHWEQNTVKLATAIAERLIKRELSRDPEISIAWIREALELVGGQGSVTVQLHPTDYETLGEQVQPLIRRLTKLGPATVVPDPGIEPGGCRVLTEFGSIDQQLGVQLKRIEEELNP